MWYVLYLHTPNTAFFLRFLLPLSFHFFCSIFFVGFWFALFSPQPQMWYTEHGIINRENDLLDFLCAVEWMAKLRKVSGGHKFILYFPHEKIFSWSCIKWENFNLGFLSALQGRIFSGTMHHLVCYVMKISSHFYFQLICLASSQANIKKTNEPAITPSLIGTAQLTHQDPDQFPNWTYKGKVPLYRVCLPPNWPPP